jgi:hypothetical protein
MLSNKLYKEIIIHILDYLNSFFPHNFCSTPSLEHSCVDIFISIHECTYMLIAQYFYGSLTNQEIGDQRINKLWPYMESWNITMLYTHHLGGSNMCPMHLVTVK